MSMARAARRCATRRIGCRGDEGATGIEGIDLLLWNLYPYEGHGGARRRFRRPPSRILVSVARPADPLRRKNRDWVTVVVDVEDYKAVKWTRWRRSNGGATTLVLRRLLAQRAFARTAAYDAAVSNWFANELEKAGDNNPPRRRAFAGFLRQPLRYGENPHPGSGLLCGWLGLGPSVATTSAASGQGTFLQQHQLHRCGL